MADVFQNYAAQHQMGITIRRGPVHGPRLGRVRRRRRRVRPRGQTDTLPLHVEIQLYGYNYAGAFAVASLLSVIAVITLVFKTLLEWKTSQDRAFKASASIQVQRIRKTYGTFEALQDVRLKIETGELVALLGPSGSGKTTLLRIIAGLDVPDSGTVLLNGGDATKSTARDRHVGFVFQNYALFRHLTVFENVTFGLRLRPRRYGFRDGDS
jgi:ABC-type multidrug transport system fused ATPase/permease subunit